MISGEEHYHHFYCSLNECKKQKVKIEKVNDDAFYQGRKSVEFYDKKSKRTMVISIGWFAEECLFI